MTLHEYILKNWSRSIRNPENPEDNQYSYVRLPDIYTTPCADGLFKNLFYWDTYFTNVGLIPDGLLNVAISNARCMSYLINNLGFMPNSDRLISNTQPPFFIRIVYEVYKASKDIKVVEEFSQAILRELEFFEYSRRCDNGLYQFRSHCFGNKYYQAFDYFNNRVNQFNKTELSLGRMRLGELMFAYGESGWDMNLRYAEKDNRFNILDYNNIDLNCILFDAYTKASIMFKDLGKEEVSKELESKALELKELINKYMFDKEQNLYLDYDFVHNKYSKHPSCASFYPFAMGVSTNKESCKKLYDLLIQENGISSSVENKEHAKMQWDYPNMWAPNVYIAYLALMNCGLTVEANDVKDKYMRTLEKDYNKSHKLFEKYNSLTGEVAVSFEYTTPEMLGWTAGIYEYFYSISEK